MARVAPGTPPGPRHLFEATVKNTAFASLVVGGVSRFYSGKPGKALPIGGAFPVPMADIAVALKQ